MPEAGHSVFSLARFPVDPDATREINLRCPVFFPAAYSETISNRKFAATIFQSDKRFIALYIYSQHGLLVKQASTLRLRVRVYFLLLSVQASIVATLFSDAFFQLIIIIIVLYINNLY